MDRQAANETYLNTQAIPLTLGSFSASILLRMQRHNFSNLCKGQNGGVKFLELVKNGKQQMPGGHRRRHAGVPKTHTCAHLEFLPTDMGTEGQRG